MKLLIALPVLKQYSAMITPLQHTAAFQQALRTSALELHVTLMPPLQLNDSQMLARRIQVWCASQPAFAAAILAVDFITTSALALMLDSAPLRPLHAYLQQELAANAPYSPHTGNQFRPHITIGRSRRGPLLSRTREQLLADAGKVPLVGEHLAFPYLRIYAKEEGIAYQPLADCPFSGSS